VIDCPRHHIPGRREKERKADGSGERRKEGE